MSNESVREVLAAIANGKSCLQSKGLIDRIAKRTGLTKIETSMEMKILLNDKSIECEWAHGEPIGQVVVNLPPPERARLKQEWQAEVAKHEFPGTSKGLASKPVKIPDRTAADIAEAFARLTSFVGCDLFLREVSSRLFWGQSKILDGKEKLISELLGLDTCPFPEKPLSVIVQVPSGNISGVLFIENEISFLAAGKGRIDGMDDLILVYASGFKSGTPRIRREASTSIFYSSSSLGADFSIQNFETWLRGDDGMFPAYFWGDLDFSGMGILASLKKVFPSIEAWKPGYAPMLLGIERNKGHSPEAAGKEKQEDPGVTGCSYADNVLLPALRKHQMFIDQE